MTADLAARDLPAMPPCDCECHVNAEALDMDESACDCFQDGESHEADAGLSDD